MESFMPASGAAAFKAKPAGRVMHRSELKISLRALASTREMVGASALTRIAKHASQIVRRKRAGWRK